MGALGQKTPCSSNSNFKQQTMASKTKGKGNKKKTTKKGGKTVGNRRSELKQELREVVGVQSKVDLVRVLFGVAFALVSIFLILAIVSNCFTGSQDQAGVESGRLTQPANYAGTLGAYVSYYMMHNLFGVFSLLIPVFGITVAIKLFLDDPRAIRLWKVLIHLTIIMAVGSVDLAFVQEAFLPQSIVQVLPFDLGGLHGKFVLEFIKHYVGMIPTGIILALLTLSYVGYWFIQVLITCVAGISGFFAWILASTKTDDDEVDEEEDSEAEEVDEEAEDDEEEESTTEEVEDNPQKEEVEVENNAPTTETPSTVIGLDLDDGLEVTVPTAPVAAEEIVPLPSPPAEVENEAHSESGEVELSVEATHVEKQADSKTVSAIEGLEAYDPRADLSRYKFPPLSLLDKHEVVDLPIDMEELNANKRRIVEVLSSFNVKIVQITATVGPTVTLYEVTPEQGVRVSKIKNLQEDIAMSLSAIGIRIIAPMPGKGTIGIEVPNRESQIVSMESLLNTQKFRDTTMQLPIAIGKTITNEVFMVDLAKMPHLLVAGATGQGKSVGLNAIITSLLYKKHPAEMKLVMIDPKKVEFSMYNPIVNHFLAQVPDSDEPVITDVKKVVQTLNSLCVEMDARYDLLKVAGCKNIVEYNAKFVSRTLNPNDGHRYLPYIVVIIDEFGDLIMTAGKDIELPIARIAQLARAVGIHMIIATQSPRTTIITGKIKANFPARMAFKVSGLVESRTILDRKGAENLIGRGDMLFMAGSDVVRLQCAFVDTPEIEKLTEYISQQQAYPYPFELPLVSEDGVESSSESFGGSGGSTFEQVAHFVVSTGQGSTSKIQRTFSIGFNRAGRLMDQLEEVGIVGPVNGSKPREVYVQTEMELEQILADLRVQGKKFD